MLQGAAIRKKIRLCKVVSGKRLPCGGSAWDISDKGFPSQAPEFYITQFLKKVLGTLRVTRKGPLEHRQVYEGRVLASAWLSLQLGRLKWEPRKIKSFVPSHVASQVLTQDEGSLLPPYCIYSALLFRLFFLPSLSFPWLCQLLPLILRLHFA